MKKLNRLITLSPPGWWVILYGYLHCIGWGLSAIHQLNKTGYGVAFVAGTLFAVVYFLAPAPPASLINLSSSIA